MTAVTNLWRQLVQRRLLPVAILLIAALVAVPLTLAKDPEPAPAPPPAQVDTKSELATTPIVAPATPQDRAKRRKVLGKSKNPFGVAKAAATGGDADGPVVQKTDTGGASKDPSSSGSGSGSGTSPTPTSTTPSTPVTPAPAPKHYAPQELTVRFGAAEGATRQSVERLEPLPSAELPVLIYTGLRKDGKTAEFLVDAGVEAVGDGECNPSPEQCETIRLREGETEFLDVKDETGTVVGEFQLDLIKIHNSSKASASKASKSRARTTSALRPSELRSVVGRVSAQLP